MLIENTNLKNVLCQIDTNYAIVHLDTPVACFGETRVWHIAMPLIWSVHLIIQHQFVSILPMGRNKVLG